MIVPCRQNTPILARVFRLQEAKFYKARIIFGETRVSPVE